MTPLGFLFFFSVLAGICMWIHEVCSQYAAEIVLPVAVK